MALYYDIERKSSCIEQEGFWKGWLWCSTDSKTQFDLGFQHTYLFVKGLTWPIKLFTSKSEQASEEQRPWFADGSEARYIRHNKADARISVYSILVVNYNSASGCRPEFSVLAMEGKKLGTVKRQVRESYFVILSVDGKSSSEYKAVRTDYSNGVEFAFLLDQDIISKMQSGQLLQVDIGGYGDGKQFPLEKFNIANESARASCRFLGKG